MTDDSPSATDGVQPLRSGLLPRPRRVVPLVLLTLLATMVWPASLASADPAPAEPMEAAADESLLFEEIPSVFSASKYEQKVTEAPSAVSIVTSDEIRKYGFRTLAEILGSLPGVFTTNDRNYQYLAVRGFGIAGDYNSRVLLLIDGHRVNDSIYGTAPMGRDFPLDVELIDRVELVRGPASALYGTSAFLGVINVVTKRGRDLQGPELAAGGGSESTYSGRASYGQRLGNGFEFLFSSTYFDSDGKRRLYYEEYDDPATSFGVAHDADNEREYSFFAQLRYRDLALQAGYGSREKGIPTGAFETLFDTTRTRSWDDTGWVDLSYQRELPRGWLFRGRTYYHGYRYDGEYLYEYSEDGEPELVLNRDEAWGDRWGSDINFSGEPFRRHRLTLGGELVYNFRQDQWNGDEFPESTYLDSRERSTDWALYAEDAFRILDNLTLFAGIRHDENGLSGGSTNPRVALVYNPLPETTLKLLYGRAFRAPTAYELFYHDGETQKTPGSLDPETIETFELVGEYEIDKHLRFVGSAYYSKIDDLIALTRDPADDLVVFENSTDLESYGLELRLEGQWENGFKGGLSWAFQRTEDAETGRRIANSPRHLAKLNLIAPIVPERLFAGLELQYVGDRRTIRGATTGGHFLANLTLLGRRFAGGLELSAGVKNLFDVEYFDPASEEHLQSRIEQNGRTYFLMSRYEF